MFMLSFIFVRRVYRCQRGNENLLFEGHRTQWQQEKEQTYKQRSTKHTHKTKDRVTQTPIKPWVNSGTLEE